ncbi:MAG TPA: hypothetical protein VF648_08720 [Pyrinomonadaceae bacterium]
MSNKNRETQNLKKNLYSPYPADASWTVDNEQIAQVGFDGSTTAISEGDAYLSANWTGQLWRGDATDACLPDEVFASPIANLIVRPPSVSISSFKAVGKNQTATVRVQVPNNPNNLPITLTLTPTSGTGTAQFTSNNTTTRTITATTDVEIKGITESSTKDNMEFKATYTKPNNQIVTLDTENFTVLSVTLSLRFSNNQTVSTNNSARNNQQTGIGTLSLGGPIFSTGQLPNRWRHVIEIVGTVLPANYSDEIVLRREVINTRSWDANNNLAGSAGCDPPQQTPCDDTSTSDFLDTDASDSAGNIYDIDSPGSTLVNAQLGTIRRRRTNFRQWATVTQNNAGQVQNVRVSVDVTWYQRLAIELTNNGIIINNVVPGDNIINSGATNTTWNLQ